VLALALVQPEALASELDDLGMVEETLLRAQDYAELQ
jgi:hypothetical protein